MGSPLLATLAGCSARRARAAWTAIREDVATTEAVLSRFRPESDLNRLNRCAGDGRWIAVPPRLGSMLGAARRAWRLTDGRFDPRVLTRLEVLGERAGVPLPERPATPRGVAWLGARPREGLARTTEPVDSGGIGKGLALRWAMRAARSILDGKAGDGGPGPHAGALIEAGGDIVARGPAPDGPGWRIAIEDPAGGDALAVIELRDAAVVTSSVAVRRWLDPSGTQVHHLIDPATGRPGGRGLQAVTVAMPDPAWAEVWSKSLFLAGPRAIGPEARSRGLAVWWVGEDGRLEMTPGARQRTIWERAEPTRRAS